ncbi:MULTISPECIES: hypothetical protein [Nocardia]|uniref:hypothetical protein n=1 Tax=Nocardia TaxID=1817 RepID=UPI000D692393|nr:MULTISPECIES: hypothetical protein [Nocardia]
MSTIRISVEIDGTAYVQAMDLSLSADFYTGAPSGIACDFSEQAAELAAKIEGHLIREYGVARELRSM